MLGSDEERSSGERRDMLQEPYVLDQVRREAVLSAIRQHCVHRGWSLLAAHVRSNHVHVVLEAEAKPELIMNEF